MAIIDRITTILRANINALLDQAEDPEVMLDQILRDMSGAIAEARGQVAEMIAQEKVLQANVERNRSLAEEWRGKAQLAVQNGRDDLAREALRRHNDYTESAEVYEQQRQAQSQLVTKLKDELQQLESKYEDAQRSRETLIARHRRAETQQRVTGISVQLNALDPAAELGRMEERIRLEEARAEAQAELADSSYSDQFAELASDSQIEAQLQEMKQELGAGTQAQALPSGQ
ncbi:MAG: PspA/IM30 family protein [Chloroflexota bacterium]|nr:PspA/IM30 family protein [Chloroflexota bacterium]